MYPTGLCADGKLAWHEAGFDLVATLDTDDCPDTSWLDDDEDGMRLYLANCMPILVVGVTACRNGIQRGHAIIGGVAILDDTAGHRRQAGTYIDEVAAELAAVALSEARDALAGLCTATA